MLRQIGRHDLQRETQLAAAAAAERSKDPYHSSRAGWALIKLDRAAEAVLSCTRALSTRSSAHAARGEYDLAIRNID